MPGHHTHAPTIGSTYTSFIHSLRIMIAPQFLTDACICRPLLVVRAARGIHTPMQRVICWDVNRAALALMLVLCLTCKSSQLGICCLAVRFSAGGALQAPQDDGTREHVSGQFPVVGDNWLINSLRDYVSEWCSSSENMYQNGATDITSGGRSCLCFFVIYCAKLDCLDAELRDLFGSCDPGQGWGMQFLGAQICKIDHWG